ncbi:MULTISPECIES: hypothetical protein [Rhizobium]|uniref:Uncharacterized protein n=1 Tax=Rhizobium phaseoli TaxID=396 RepID=A0A7T0EHK3_9HYPH|nr:MULTISPECIES: hypothetical protein [Rhizobium]MDE8758706.1 hypothetical protein [Rhizobium sp. CBK13]MDK4724340.1 hypothetical protein [Rhizobium phaseoli]NKE88335.1 hypothetical protein [Rhizobium phaseoli]NKF09976.1 hypothetical protein [Rhizobium phaseoli]PDS72920.1 hypothetical protein CO651_06125 [Rhizobium phaseoli]
MLFHDNPPEESAIADAATLTAARNCALTCLKPGASHPLMPINAALLSGSTVMIIDLWTAAGRLRHMPPVLQQGEHR